MIRVVRSFARARLGGWALGVCSVASDLSGVNALLIRAAFILGLVFSPAITVSAYAALFAFAKLVGIVRSADDPDNLLEAPFQPDDSARLKLSTDIVTIERRLAQMEAEALSADALTRARFRNAGL